MLKIRIQEHIKDFIYIHIIKYISSHRREVIGLFLFLHLGCHSMKASLKGLLVAIRFVDVRHISPQSPLFEKIKEFLSMQFY